MKNVVKGDDIYHKTTPKEWKEFEEVIQKSGPFDIVLDGLNVAYCANPDFNSRPTQNKSLFVENQDHIKRNKPCAYSVIIQLKKKKTSKKKINII